MITKILITLGIIFILFILLCIYSCFIMSGRISEAERRAEINNKNS
ncbi:hypothetical protein KHQ81_06675 [Mycoplasmatota bacterium]|nr:hypothetical protein KHQ81_06675 [Mycoplasmatota bacterium]